MLEEENLELMLLIHEGLREPLASSRSVDVDRPKVGRFAVCALAEPVGVWVGVLGVAVVLFCLGCDSDGGVTATGAGFLFDSGEGTRAGCCACPPFVAGEVPSFATVNT